MEPNCTIKRTAIRPGFDTVRKLFFEYDKIEQAKDRLRRPGVWQCVARLRELAHWLDSVDNRELWIRERERLRGRNLILTFLAYCLKIDTPESVIVFFFTAKVSSLISVDGGKALSRSLNDKIPNIWYLVFATTRFSPKLVSEWRRLPHFPAKMTLVDARALLSIEKISFSLTSSF